MMNLIKVYTRALVIKEHFGVLVKAEDHLVQRKQSE